MKTNLSVFFTLTAILIINICSAQKPLPNTLLWRISGKGLTKPSYLFGTMHLTDKRLFRFDDSVYHAIEYCDGFAMEISPDEIAAYAINKATENYENSKSLKEVLGEAGYKKYSKALSKKLKIPADQITSNDIVKQKNSWMTEALKKGEMPTLVDAYLYNIARRQGKWTGGVEDMADQSGLLDDNFDMSDIRNIVDGDNEGKMNQYLEKMIKIYSDQDIEALNRLTNDEYDSTRIDALLIKRNKKMARRIDSLSAFRTMFIAIGAAHLAGEEGVISLLKRRGFTVEPVLSSNKIESKDYHYKEQPVKWFDVEGENHYYSAKMPGNPAEATMYGIVKMKMLLDLSNYTVYCTMAMTSTVDMSDKDKAMKDFTLKMFKGMKGSTPKKISKNGVDGMEFTSWLEGYKVKLQLYIKGKVVYMVMLYGLKEEVLTTADAQKFFDSFTINDVSEVKASVSTFVDSAMGVSIDAPAKLTLNEQMTKQQVQEQWNSVVYAGIDYKSGSYIMLIYKEVLPGYYIKNDSLMLAQQADSWKEKFNVSTFNYLNVQGCSALKLQATNSESPGIGLRSLTVLRGNKFYSLMVVADTSRLFKEETEKIFNSFKLLPYKQNKWSLQQAPDNSFECWLPAPIKDYSKDTATPKKIELDSYDNYTATTFNFRNDTINKYTWYKTDTSYWKRIKTDIVGQDTLIYERDINSGSADIAREYYTRLKNGEVYERSLIQLHGNVQYRIYTSGDNDYLQSEPVNKLYSSFNIKTKSEKSTLFNSKTSLILNDLLSDDSTTRNEANVGLYNADFGNEDLSALQNALFKKYKSLYKDSVSDDLNQRIGMVLKDISDSTTIQLVQKEYDGLIGDKAYLRNTALMVQTSVHTKENFNQFLKMLEKHPLTEAPDSRLINNLTDSLSLTASIYPSLLQYAKDSIWGTAIAYIGIQLIDSGFISIKDIAASEQDFNKLALNLLPNLKKKHKDVIDYYLYDLVKLLKEFKSSTSFNTLKSYLKISDNELKKEVILALLENKQAVDTISINAVAADPKTCLDFYSTLKEKKLLAYFPKRYITQRGFAAATVYNTMQEEDQMPDGINYLSKKIATVNGKKYAFYLFKVVFKGANDSTEEFLGIAGEYDIAGKLLEPKDNYSEINWNQKITSDDSIKEMFDDYINRMNQ